MENHTIYDLSYRAQLAPRNKPYWHQIEPNKYLGYMLRVRSGPMWMARVRNTAGSYNQVTLAKTDDHGDGGWTFEDALKAAQTWFETKAVKKESAVPHVLRYCRQLIICPVGPVFTIGHALADYVEWKRIAAANTHFEAVLSLINHHIIRRLSGIEVDAFNSADFQKFCLDVLESPPVKGYQAVGPRRKIHEMPAEDLRKRKKTLNTLVSILRGAIKLAWENDKIPSIKPLKYFKRVPCFDQPRTYFLTPDESNALLGVCKPELHKLVLGALYTGCRANELINLKVADVAKLGFGINIKRAKNYRSRFVYLPDEGMIFFLSMIEGKNDTDFVFQNSKGRKWSQQYAYHMRVAVAAAGLPKEVVFHSLRHTYASRLIQSGMALSTIAKLLGHNGTQTTEKIYGHLSPSASERDIQNHFVSLDKEIMKKASNKSKKLSELKASFGTERKWVPQNQTTWPRANYSRLDGDTLRALKDHENALRVCDG